MTYVGIEYKRRPDAKPEAPKQVIAVQYVERGNFYQKKDFLEFCDHIKLSMTIYKDAMVVHTAQRDVKIVGGDWILSAGKDIYFLRDVDFQETYEKAH